MQLYELFTLIPMEVNHIVEFQGTMTFEVYSPNQVISRFDLYTQMIQEQTPEDIRVLVRGVIVDNKDIELWVIWFLRGLLSPEVLGDNVYGQLVDDPVVLEVLEG